MKNIIKEITTILPIFSVNNDKDKEFLNKALESIIWGETVPSKILIVIPSDYDLEKEYKLPDYSKEGVSIEVVKNPGKTDYASQINFGVEKVESTYFSIIEMDDEYSKIYFKNVDKYLEKYNSYSLFLPLIAEIDMDNKFLQFTNEMAFHNVITENHGFIDKTEGLLNIVNFNISGAVFKKEDFIAVGKLKSNIKITNGYEFILRLIDQGFKALTIPKIGYTHRNGREGSYLHTLNHSETPITNDEIVFWFEKAKTEYMMPMDREIEYSVKEDKTPKMEVVR